MIHLQSKPVDIATIPSWLLYATFTKNYQKTTNNMYIVISKPYDHNI